MFVTAPGRRVRRRRSSVLTVAVSRLAGRVTMTTTAETTVTSATAATRRVVMDSSPAATSAVSTHPPYVPLPCRRRSVPVGRIASHAFNQSIKMYFPTNNRKITV